MFNNRYVVFLFVLLCVPCLYGAVISSVVADMDPAPQYQRLELTVLTPSSYANPFDPCEVDLWGEFASPSQQALRINGFWDGTVWKIRFAGAEVGQWTYIVKMRDAVSTAQTSGSFSVSPSSHHGWIRVSRKDSHYLEHDDGTPFYGVGFCRPWQVYSPKDPNLFDDMQANGCNLFVLWMASWDNLLLVNNSSGYDRYDMPNAANLDRVFEDIEGRNICVVLTVWYHDFLRDENHSWPNPQYQTENPFRNLSSCTEFFTDATSWQCQQKFYRYLIARWGYSRSLAMWQTVSEYNGTNAVFAPLARLNDADGWHNKINDYFVSNDTFRHPTTISDGGDCYWPEGYEVADVPQMHSYDHADDAIGVASRMAYWHNMLFTCYDKPGWMGEFGMRQDIHTDEERTMFIHNGIWAALVNGAATTPMQWLDTGAWGVMSSGMYEQMRRFRAFVDQIDIPAAGLEPAGQDGTIVTTLADGKAWALAGTIIRLAWLQDTTPGEAVSDAAVVFPSLDSGNYLVSFYDAWQGQYVLTAEYMHKVGGDMTILCPDFTNDIVIKIERIPTPDINHDSLVGLEDFAALAQSWLDDDCGWCRGANLQPDGRVDINDMAVLAQTWLDVMNWAPTVNAGSDQWVILPDNVIDLSGSVSDDGYPAPPSMVSVSWGKVSGPNDVTFADCHVVDTAATFTQAGTYLLRLTADDSEAAAFDLVTVDIFEPTYEPTSVYVFRNGLFRNTWRSGTGGVPVPFASSTAPDGTPTAAVQTSALGWTEIRSAGVTNIGDRKFLRFDVYFDTDVAPQHNFAAMHMSVDGDNGWIYKWEGPSACRVDGRQLSMGTKTFSPKTWHSFELDLTSTYQGGPFPPTADIGVIRVWVPGPVAMHIKNVRFGR